MSTVVRKYRRGGWQVDIRLELPDKSAVRERKVFRTASKLAAQRWGQDRERHLLLNGLPKHVKEVPTLAEFAPRFMDGRARANRQKPSGIAAKEMILRVHLIPALGHRRLDAISDEDVQRLKTWLGAKASKTVNNVLAVLSVMFKKAVEWKLIDRMPCTIRLLPVPKSQAAFYDVEDYEHLVDAARGLDPRTHLIVLLGGQAGLRCGEMIALEWSDIDFVRRQLCIRQSDWNGQVTTPKGGTAALYPAHEPAG